MTGYGSNSGEINLEGYAELRNEHLRIGRERTHLTFLNMCKNHNVIPKFLRICNRTLTLQFRREVVKFETLLLKKSIRMKHQHIREIKRTLTPNRKKYEDQHGRANLETAMSRINIYRDMATDRLTEMHYRKVMNLIREKKDVPTTALHVLPKPVPFINTSQKSFSTRDTAILEMGPKYIFQHKPKLIEIIPQIEGILANVEWPNKELLRAELAIRIQKEIKKEDLHCDHTLKRIKEIKKEHDIAITLTDKSNKIFIMDRDEYEGKMMTTIQEMKCREVKSDPLEALSKKVHNLIKEGEWPGNQTPIFTNYYDIPNIIGRVKDHKENNPIRPIVTKYTAPTYHIEKACATILKELLPVSNRVIISTMDFVSKIKNIGVRKNEQMISLDIVKLYPSINMTKVEKLIHTAIDNHVLWNNEIKITMKRAISLILRNNFFTFKNKIYLQEEGAPMGSPISGLLAEFIVRPLEEDIISKFPHIRVWFRYADDIYMLWNKDHDFDHFLDEVNKMDSHIKFTHEKEKKNSINYLDLTLNHKKGRIYRDVYRKPIASNAIIPKHAFTLARYKRAAISFMASRALRFCSKGNLQGEINRIIEIVGEAGYDEHTVYDAFNRIVEKKKHPPAEKERPIIAGSIQYYKGITEPIMKVLKKYNVQIAIKNSLKMPNVICNIKPPMDMSNSRGVYRIPFSDEKGVNRTYIGQTRRKLHIRIGEHFKDIAFNRNTTALAKVNKSERIEIDFGGTSIIAPYTDHIGTLTRESLEICKAGQQTCNYQDSYKVSSVWRDLFAKDQFRRRTNRPPIEGQTDQEMEQQSRESISTQTYSADGDTAHIGNIPTEGVRDPRTFQHAEGTAHASIA